VQDAMIEFQFFLMGRIQAPISCRYGSSEMPGYPDPHGLPFSKKISRLRPLPFRIRLAAQ
jgi:hypothetical protein